jgi:hypothetical protein
MRPVEELINRIDPGWTVVRSMIDSAKNKTMILPVDTARAKKALYELQVTSRSSLGAVVLNTGGIMVDNGWIRILGSGSTRLEREVMQWNKKLYTAQNPGYIIVADDVLGGFFLLNGGGLGEDIGHIYYFSPDNLEFEPMRFGYTDFLWFCFTANLDEFYAGFRWKNWQSDISSLKTDEAYHFFPMLFTKEGKEIGKSIKKPVPVDELYFFNLDMRKQLGLEKTDTIGHE